MFIGPLPEYVMLILVTITFCLSAIAFSEGTENRSYIVELKKDGLKVKHLICLLLIVFIPFMLVANLVGFCMEDIEKATRNNLDKSIL